MRTQFVRFLAAKGLLLSLVFVMAGCATPVQTPSFAEPISDNLTITVHPSVRNERVELVSASLTDTENGLKQVVAQFHKKGSGSARMFYRAVWFDGYGTPLKSLLSNWQAVFIEEGLYADVRMLAPTAKAQKARLELTIKKKSMNRNSTEESQR